MKCCDKDGYIVSLRLLARVSGFIRAFHVKDWAYRRVRDAVLLRHPWMGIPR